jgi:hypothetical protein
VTWCLKARIVEPEENTLARQWLCKQVPAAMNTHTIIEELLNTMFSMWSAPMATLNLKWMESRGLVLPRTSYFLYFLIIVLIGMHQPHNFMPHLWCNYLGPLLCIWSDRSSSVFLLAWTWTNLLSLSHGSEWLASLQPGYLT